jgi:hypothetical protein
MLREFESPIGEVVAAATTGFMAQVIRVPRPDEVVPVPDPPPFGAFVRVGPLPDGDGVAPPDDFDPFEAAPPASEDPDAPVTLYAVVCQAEIGALEGSGRPLTAFGLDEDELRQQQPQIFELLTARFTAILVAYAAVPDGEVRPFLPPRPPRPHARVFRCSDAETVRLTAQLDYLRPLLLGAGGVLGVTFPQDELVAALLRGAVRAHRRAGGNADAFLERAGRELASLLSGDYDRLRAIIRRVVA